MKSVLIAAALALTLAACAGPHGHPVPPARGIPSPLGDRAPHDWRGAARPDRLPIHGIDISRYQGAIDWRQVAASGVKFALVKATEGGDYADPSFEDNMREARWAGIAVGAYHFYYFCTSPEDQAKWFIQNVPRHEGDLPPILDIEWNHNSRTCRRRPDAETVRRDITIFSNLIQRHYGQRPVIYTAPDLWRDADLAQMQGQDFWLRSVAGHPALVYPDAHWTFWQYTGTGAVRGINADVDLNAFGGTALDWALWRAQRQI
ncbi:glycoside hydrolase [Thioclava sp. BHET1]|nr:glycoside hydrolase [Thioclava sp. BHET1]